MKNYVAMRGIKQEPVTIDTKIGRATITDMYPCETSRGRGYHIEVAGKQYCIAVTDRPEITAIVNNAISDREAMFLARYPGIDELLTAINNERDYHKGVQAMMDDEDNDGVNPPATPKITSKEARQLYPIAAAYLTILAYADSDPSSQIGYVKRQSGNRAIEQIESGADVVVTRDIMVKAVNDTPLDID